MFAKFPNVEKYHMLKTLLLYYSPSTEKEKLGANVRVLNKQNLKSKVYPTIAMDSRKSSKIAKCLFHSLNKGNIQKRIHQGMVVHVCDSSHLGGS